MAPKDALKTMTDEANGAQQTGILLRPSVKYAIITKEALTPTT